MEAAWKIELFGWLRAYYGDDVVVSRFQSHQTAALLAYLALKPQRTHPRIELADMLWPEADPSTVRDRLNQALSSLRRQFEPPGITPGTVLFSDRYTVRLNPAMATTDVAEFSGKIAEAKRLAEPTEKIRALTEAATLYRGEL